MSLARIDDDMRAVIAAERLCFAATVTPDGRPNLSPKGTIRVWDEHHLFFCDIASPGTRANLAANDWIELNVVEARSRRGYRFLGRATVHRGDAVYAEAVARITREEGSEYPVEAVVLVAVERALPVISPGYDHVADEWQMRVLWQERRRELDAEFEIWIARRGAVKGRG
jgi:predicted pyridoxine 5'-phosphate oxidase superfamily flavin-nucleotide-binding protein